MKRRKFIGKTALGTAGMVGFPSIVPANVIGKMRPVTKLISVKSAVGVLLAPMI